MQPVALGVRHGRLSNSNIDMELFPVQATSNEGSKELGSYYTSRPVADFLVRWAVRNSRDTVLDPSFGAGVFLDAASDKLRELGGDPSAQIFGVEFDKETHTATSSGIETSGVSGANLLLNDFFDVEPLPVNRVNAIVGNPPFIRYQRFRDDVRKKALQRAAECGVNLSQLSSSWAPFIVHSISMLKKGGRLAMVLPAELGYANYAAPVLSYMVRSFGRVTILTFKEKLFPHLSEDTLLLLANDRGSHSDQILHRDFDKVSSLANVRLSKNYKLYRTRHLNVESMLDRSERLIEYLLPRNVRDLYLELRNSPSVCHLGSLAKVGIGYVTGANNFFHLSPDEVRDFSIPENYLRPAVRRGRALSGLSFTSNDWSRALPAGDAGYLLYINGQGDPLPQGVTDYLQLGLEQGVAEAFKCKVRKPWYSVPHVNEADGFLTYMSGSVPRLVANEAAAVAPNTLHVLKMKTQQVSARALAVRWATSLSRLSAEIEGHPLGGGMLKLEPGEAERTLIAAPGDNSAEWDELYSRFDELFRSGKEGVARKEVDNEILRSRLGLSSRDCDLLSQGASILMNRRYRRTE